MKKKHSIAKKEIYLFGFQQANFLLFWRQAV